MASRIRVNEDIQPLTTFRNNSVEMVKRIKRTKRALVLTVNGKPEMVLQSVDEYQRLLDAASEADEQEGLRQALDDLKHGRSRLATEVLEELRISYGFSSATATARRA